MQINMKGSFIDNIRFRFKKAPTIWELGIYMISTDYGRIRILDTKGDKPILINVPDGPNVIEHQEHLITKLSKTFRVICFEFPGIGFSYPNSKYDYSFEKSAKLIVNIMDILKVPKAILSFSCSNGFYAIKTAQMFPERVTHLFLSQTASVSSMIRWKDHAIPSVLTYPIIGQVVNSFIEKKLAKVWYNYALPKTTDKSLYQQKAQNALQSGGCFCLSGLVQGLSHDINSSLEVLDISSTLIWGSKDYTHRKTESNSIVAHLPNCEIIEFKNCGHFPELEDTNNYVKLLNERLPPF